MENKSIQHNVASISDLPSEMLEKILKNIDTSNLLSNRTVNRQWNELSSRIMRIRDTTLHFALSDGNYIKHFQHLRCEKCSLNLCSSISTSDAKRLTDLVLCLNESSLFPFTSFRFDGMSMGSWDSLMTFLTIWGRNIQQLRVCMSGSKNKIEILLMSLLEKVPNLKILAFIHYSRFPCSVSLPADTQRQFRLPNLEVLYVYYPSGIYGSIFEKILTAAPHLKKFYKTLSPEDFEMLHRTEKFHCLKDLKIEITKDLIDYWKKSPNHFDLQLRSLTLSLNDDIYMDQQLKFDASIIINQLLQSNGNNLRTLSTQPLEPLKGLVLPKFGNLRLLRCQRTLNHGNYKMLPQTWTVFPNMKELDVEPFRGAYSKIFDESLKTLPSVATLRISLNSNSDGLDDLIKRTPNVTTMSIAVSLKYDDSLDYSYVFSPLPTVNYKNISMYLPKLENLRWHFFFEEHKVDYQLDALITGLPPHLCYALAKELRYIDHLPEDEVPNYWEPCNPSLLDLKELKTLHFVLEKSSPYSSYGRKSTKKDKALDSAGFGPESIFYQTGITKISKLLVFDRMPNLKVVVHKVES